MVASRAKMVIDSTGSHKPSDDEEFNINIYRYVPDEEPLNFVSMFVKFPQEDIEHL